jgi:hypothetical protein
MRTNEELQKENDELRYRLAISNAPCAYCQLAKCDMNKCLSGFPGCARMDDILVGEQSEPTRSSTTRLGHVPKRS